MRGKWVAREVTLLPPCHQRPISGFHRRFQADGFFALTPQAFGFDGSLKKMRKTAITPTASHAGVLQMAVQL